MNNVLVDTNILIYAIDQDSQFHEKSQELLFNPKLQLFTTSKNLSEFLVVVTKGLSSALSVDDALSVVTDYMARMIILYPSEISFSVFRRLLQKYHPHGLRIHDFEIISIALAHNVKEIATKNIRDFKNIKEIILLDGL